MRYARAALALALPGVDVCVDDDDGDDSGSQWLLMAEHPARCQLEFGYSNVCYICSTFLLR